MQNTVHNINVASAQPEPRKKMRNASTQATICSNKAHSTPAADSLAFFLLILSPWASNYVFYSAVSIGDLFIIACVPWLLSHFTLKPFNLLVSLSASIIILLSLLTIGPDVYAGFYRTAFYFFLFFIVTSLGNLDFSELFRRYTAFCLFASILLLLQWIGRVAFNFTISLQLPLSYYEPDTLLVIDHVFRSGGPFREPSYFSLFIGPALFFLLTVKRYMSYTLIVAAGVVSTSSLIAFLVPASALYLLSKRTRLLPSFVLLWIPFFLGSGYIALSFSNSLFEERIVNIFLNGGTLVERFIPLTLVASASESFFANDASYRFLLTEKYWFNSASSLIGYLGFASIALMVISLLRSNLLIASTYLGLIFSTHIMSSAYCLLIATLFAALHSKVDAAQS